MSEESNTLSPRDESRLDLAACARTLSERSARLVAVEIDPEPGTLIMQAREIQAMAQELLSAAVVAERERYTSPEQVVEAAGNAHWEQTVLAWARDGRRNRAGLPGLMLARSLDEWVAKHNPDVLDAVTCGLDATRFPGSAAFAAYERERVAALYAALEEAEEAREEVWKELNALSEKEDSVDHPTNLRVVAALRRLTQLYTDLSVADPPLAVEYRSRATWNSTAADRFEEHGPMGG
ncbi:hypothetical protein [Streptomyces sp. NPDC094032]|uniref:hypothetical protein n=1 Tax=Streptomyces sp. NPDC094032 TaxID=3155308 RepID=UPI0033179F92